MPDDTRDTGIPTRAIHQAYLRLHHAFRAYRQAKTDPSRDANAAHGDFQESVLTFYELIRAHLARKSSLQKYWAGSVPEYPDQAFGSYEQARRYYVEGGTAVWTVQKHREVQPLTGDAASPAVADGGVPSLADWHERLNRGSRTRLVTVERDRDEGVLYWVEFRFEMGLRQLDTWETTRVEHTEQRDGGFLVGESETRTEYKHVAIDKLQRAARVLAEAADKMSLLSQIDVDHEDGVITNFDQSGDEPTAGYTTGEYDSSPDI